MVIVLNEVISPKKWFLMTRTMRTTTVYLCFACMSFWGGCAGREANPVSTYLPGDENLSCDAFKKELVRLQAEMLALLPKTDKTLTNTLWGVGGVVAIIPFFFIDMKDAEKVEYEAFRRRHNRLLLIAQEKGCVFSDIRAEPIPSLEESKTIQDKPHSTVGNQEQVHN